MIEIIGFPQSNFVWAVRIACAEKGVPHSLVPRPPHHPEVAAIHPLGKVPVMRHGAVALAESRAICLYLDHAFPGPALMPRGAAAAARAEQWLSIVTGTVETALVRRYLFAFLFPGTADGRPDPARVAADWAAAAPLLPMLEAAVAEGFVGGAAFTLADAFLLPILHYATALPEAEAAMREAPRLTDWLARMRARPSVGRTTPPPLPEADQPPMKSRIAAS